MKTYIGIGHDTSVVQLEVLVTGFHKLDVLFLCNLLFISAPPDSLSVEWGPTLQVAVQKTLEISIYFQCPDLKQKRMQEFLILLQLLSAGTLSK